MAAAFYRDTCDDAVMALADVFVLLRRAKNRPRD